MNGLLCLVEVANSSGVDGPATTKCFYKTSSDVHRMERRELRHDRHTVSLLTDHIVFSPKYRGKIPVGDVALAVGIIRDICKEMKIEIIDMAVKNQEKPNAKTLCAGSGLKSGV